MSFNGDNMSPLGGNARAGDNINNKNAPMGWTYQSDTDDLATVLSAGYFDTFNLFLQVGQFIYVFLTDTKAIITVESVDRNLKQVTIDSEVFQPGEAAGQTLAQTLNIGNTSGSNDIIMDSGQTLQTDKIDAVIGPLVITDDNALAGAQYAADYSPNFVDRSLVDKDYSDFKSFLAQNNQSTGITGGLDILSNTFDTISISAGTGFVQDYSDSANPVTNIVSVAAQPAYMVVNLFVAGFYALALDKNGATVEILSDTLTTQDFRDFIIFGAYFTDGISIQTTVRTPLNIGYCGIFTAKDFINDVVGPSNVDGNIISDNGANLSLDNTGGTIFITAANFRDNPVIPDQPIIPAANVFTFQKNFRNAAGTDVILDGPPTTVINPAQFDDGSGVLQTVSNNNFTIQVIYITKDKFYVVAYGQEVFNSIATAENALVTGNLLFVEVPVVELLVRRSFLIVRNNATDLSDSAQAKFFSDGKFRDGTLGTTGGIPQVNVPGGANTDIQFNDSSLFGGDSDFTWDKTAKALVVNGLINGARLGKETTTFFLNDAVPSGIAFSVFIGNLAGQNITNGSSNTLVGASAGENITTGIGNAGFGNQSLRDLIQGDDNSAFGTDALRRLDGSSGNNDNTGIGNRAGEFLITGLGNLLVGDSVAALLTNGSRNLIIGSGANVPAALTDDFLNIGDLIFGDLSGGFLQIGGALQIPPGPEKLNVQGDLVVTGFVNGAKVGRVLSNFFLNSVGAPSGVIFSVFVGNNAGNAITTGNNNTLVGSGSGQAITVGDGNTGLGNDSLRNITQGDNNSAVGTSSLQDLDSTVGNDDNAAVGFEAGRFLRIGLGNVFIGSKTAPTLQVGNNNIVIGVNADVPGTIADDFLNIGGLIFGDLSGGFLQIGGTLQVPAGPEKLNVQGDFVVSGFVNNAKVGRVGDSVFLSANVVPAAALFTVAIGARAGLALTNGTANNLVGIDSGLAITTGRRNNVFGRGALSSLTGGDDNVIFGPFAALNLTGTSSDNCAYGKDALGNMVTGGNNTIFGTQAGLSLTSGSGNIIIGSGANAPAPATSNFLSIGNKIHGDLAGGNFAIGGSPLPPDTDVSLDLLDDDKVFRVNQIDNTAEGALTLKNGMIWYNTTSNKYKGVENGLLRTFTTT